MQGENFSETISAPIAQWIECQPAELKIQVRFLLGALFKRFLMEFNKIKSPSIKEPKRLKETSQTSGGLFLMWFNEIQPK